MWTTKHDEFCLENRIAPAVKLLWQWLIRQGQEQEIEPDLADFNNWVATHRGKPYHRQTLKDALAKLVNLRVISVVRQFTWRISRLVLRPLSWLTPKKNSRRRQEICAPPTSNPQYAEQKVEQQQHSLPDETVVACTEAGIILSDKLCKRLVHHSADDVTNAIALFHLRGGHEKIGNPSGWLNDCLRDQWWFDQEAYWRRET